MQELKDYVDFYQYCKALNEITGIDIEIIIKIVNEVFDNIGSGTIDSILGFKQIEDVLYQKMQKKTPKHSTKKLVTRQSA